MRIERKVSRRKSEDVDEEETFIELIFSRLAARWRNVNSSSNEDEEEDEDGGRDHLSLKAQSKLTLSPT